MVTRACSFRDVDGMIETFDIDNLYQIRRTNYDDLSGQGSYYVIRFFKIKKIDGILNKLKSLLYTNEQFELLPFHMFGGQRYDRNIWYGERYHVLYGNDFVGKEDIKSSEEVFDYFKRHHLKLFDWLLFHPELF